MLPVVPVVLANPGIGHRWRFPHRIAALFTPLPSPWLSSTLAPRPLFFCFPARGLGRVVGVRPVGHGCGGTGFCSGGCAPCCHLFLWSGVLFFGGGSAAVVLTAGPVGRELVTLPICSVRAVRVDWFAWLPAGLVWVGLSGLWFPCASGAAVSGWLRAAVFCRPQLGHPACREWRWGWGTLWCCRACGALLCLYPDIVASPWAHARPRAYTHNRVHCLWFSMISAC